MSSNRQDRSRSPTRVGNVGRRRDKNQDSRRETNNTPNSLMNQQQQMMMPNMYAQAGNMMMPGGMYPNMMMSNAMMGGSMMPSAGMDMMTTPSMDIMPQPAMDMSSMGIAQPPLPLSTGTPIDMNMMGGMMMDSSMMGMYPGMTDSLNPMVEKKEIVLKYCKLTPPGPGANEPPHRERPLGCRTIFVGGLPDKIRENVVREIFENYGRIHTLRLSTKNFCHIRYEREHAVDGAMSLSGYCIKLTGKEDKEEGDEDSKATTGWLHVDYALSRDDQNEYERRQRQAIRAQEQQMKQLSAQQMALASQGGLGGAYRRSPSPLRIQPFSHGAIVQLTEKVKNEQQFSSTLPTLIAWLERGECSKKNSAQFYSMIQATNAHIRRLFNEKIQAEEELQETKERIKNHIEQLIDQLEQVAKVFTAATHQRVWDHFTKAQRKNIETWQKMTQEFTSLREDFNEKFYAEESDYNGFNSHKVDSGNEDVQRLKLENDSLRFQLEAYKNEIDVVKADVQKDMEKFKAQFIARQALQGAFEKNPPLPTPVVKPPPPPPLPDDLDAKVHLKAAVEAGCGEAKLIGIMSAFLQVHPQGASLDYVVSYVRALFPHASQATVHRVLQKHADVFARATSGVGANIEHRWSFVAFADAAAKQDPTA